MLAIIAFIAFIAFILALIFHLAAGSVAQYFLDAELIGFIFLAAHFAFGERISGYWTRTRA